ncbi:MAG: type III-A CRISPR-associated RAMP protein Csm3 [Ignavibacteria bacterium]|nr:type III-A CRISPR-associated RAMP protein Csm3 [Ignavibacteria bacterium]
MNKKKYKVTVKILTGFHIGAGNDKIQIGGVDSAVIKDPVTNLPYIPGSSLKGKIRCLLETESNNYKGENDETLNKYFGSKKTDDKNQTPTRFIFRDLFLNKTFEEKFKSGAINTEFKTEIVIDRNKGTAKSGGLRTIERVPPSVVFEGEILVRYMNGDEEKELQKILKEGIKLLNNDYLGGSGSRGYGAVEVSLEEVKQENKNA